jgi:hypothetical protein
MNSNSPSQLKILSKPDWVNIIPKNNDIKAQIIEIYEKLWSKKTNSVSLNANSVMKKNVKEGICV